MQLTDAEIREILIRKKREKRRKMMRRRRITSIVLVVLIIALVVGIKIYAGKDTSESSQNSSTASSSSSEESTSTVSRGIIFLDPGHGGSDPGSISGDVIEKEDTLDFALAVKDYLQSEGFTVVMSREDDIDVDRTERGNMANDANAQLMVCIHRNIAQSDNTGEGIEAYVPSFDTGDSTLLAQNIIDALVSQGFTERTITQGEYLSEGSSDYEELANTQMPACIVEVGFINSDSDNELFNNNFENNAKAVSDAIIKTFSTLYESDGTDTDTDADADTDADTATSTENTDTETE